MKAVFLLVFHK